MEAQWIQHYLDILCDLDHPCVSVEEMAREIGCDVEWLEQFDNDERYHRIMERMRTRILEHLPRLLAALLDKGLKGDATVVRLLWMMTKPEAPKSKRSDDHVDLFKE